MSQDMAGSCFHNLARWIFFQEPPCYSYFMIYIEMFVTGVLFGAWPLLMNRSGLTGISATAVMGVVTILVIMPFVLKNGTMIAGTNWWFAIAAGLCGAIGSLVH